jgi:nucleoside-diphosphate-sugar epimerase
MDVPPLAVTGVSGAMGQRFLRHLDDLGWTDRVVGIDTREPRFRPRFLDFHAVDLGGPPADDVDLAPLLEGCETLVHLAFVLDPDVDPPMLVRVNVGGTRRLLDAATRAGVRRVVYASSTMVYGAWPDNAVPLDEDAPVRPSAGFHLGPHKAENERLLREWAQDGDRTVVVLRFAFVLSDETAPIVAAAALGRAPGTAGAAPVQYLHVDDAASALAHALAPGVAGVFNVAPDGWLSAEQADRLVGRRRPRWGRASTGSRGLAERVWPQLWAVGWAEVPPALAPYLRHPWVAANDRYRATGWAPRHSNEDALLLCARSAPPPTSRTAPKVAAAAAVAATGAAIAWRRRRP